MADSDLACLGRYDTAGKQETRINEPYATTLRVATTSPAFSRPCAPPLSDSASTRTDAANGGWSIRYDRHSPHASAVPQKAGSVSSAGASTLTTPMSSIDLQKASFAKEHEPKRSSPESKRSRGSKGSRSSRDPEKGMSGSRTNLNPSSHHNTVTYVEDEQPDEAQRLQEDKAMKILLFLSAPCVLLSSLNTAWACVAVVITVLSQPIRICARRPTFGQQLAGLLGPTLNLQLRCIYTPLPPHANEDASYHTFMLAAVQFFSPFLSFVMMFIAWTLAVYWISSKMIGDPAGQDKRDDGKETILGLRRWWEGWLMRSVKEE